MSPDTIIYLREFCFKTTYFLYKENYRKQKKEFNFLKQEPAYKKEGADPNRGSHQQ